jgi:hypothetical protein
MAVGTHERTSQAKLAVAGHAYRRKPKTRNRNVSIVSVSHAEIWEVCTIHMWKLPQIFLYQNLTPL